MTWALVGESVTELHTVPNIGRLLEAAKRADIPVVISPHYYYPTDHGWRFEGALEKVMHSIGMFDRKGPLTLDGFEDSGADFMPEYKPGFPISPWYRTHRINRRVLSLQGSDARSRTTEGDTWWVKKKTVRFSSHSTAC